MHLTKKSNRNPVPKRKLPLISVLRSWIVEITIPEDQGTKVPVSEGQPMNPSNDQPPITDPVSLRLAELAGIDLALRQLMEKVVAKAAILNELARFQGWIPTLDAVEAEIREREATRLETTI